MLIQGFYFYSNSWRNLNKGAMNAVTECLQMRTDHLQDFEAKVWRINGVYPCDSDTCFIRDCAKALIST